MTTSLMVPAVPWGDRTELLPKRMQYVLSLDFEAECTGPALIIRPRTGEGLRHLFDEVVATTPEGLRCDLPQARILGGVGEIGDPNDPLSSALQTLITLDLDGTSDPLDIQCDGVVIFAGGPPAFRSDPPWSSLSGAAFVATSHETASATYRWLNRRQLYGVGQVSGSRVSGRGVLSFSFDLYAAA